jgi:general secretion pathway protein G
MSLATAPAHGTTYASESRFFRAKSDIAVLGEVLEGYKQQHGSYPTTDQGLAVLAERSLIRRLPQDPWGHPYQYQSPGEKNRGGYDLWSLGADGKAGGSELDADFGNWPGSIQAYEQVARSQGRKDIVISGVMWGTFIGLALGLPIYTAGVVIAYRRGDRRPSWRGFHLGVLIYLWAVCVTGATFLAWA